MIEQNDSFVKTLSKRECVWLFAWEESMEMGASLDQAVAEADSLLGSFDKQFPPEVIKPRDPLRFGPINKALNNDGRVFIPDFLQPSAGGDV